MIRKIITFSIIILYSINGLYPQDIIDTDLPVIDYTYPSEYEIADISISGVKFLDKNILIQLSGLQIGETILIPGERITRALEKLWSQGLFSDIKITANKFEGNKIYLDIFLRERPRLSRFSFTGISRGESQDLTEKLNLISGSQVTENVINNANKIVREHFTEKGFYNIVVNFVQEVDPDRPNSVILNAHIEKNNRVKIEEIFFEGNIVYSDKKLRRVMKNTKKKNMNIFKASKFIEKNFKEDRESLTDFYNENGYRDFEVISDSIYPVEQDRINLRIEVDEGNRYYHRNITWVGNTKFPSYYLSNVLNIKKGDPYNRISLEERLFYDEDAVSSVYMDNGYLFSSITPVEVSVENDSIDLEMRIYEGEPATINKVIIRGNTKTNEHVVRRELRTLPGDLFSKTLIMRSAREIAQLGHFDPEKISPNPIPDPANGTVDLEFNLEERANDQFEISGGWGANMLIGTIGLRFNNFAARNIFKPKSWTPVPTGDGQTLSVRAQSNGRYYSAYNLSFIEPWLGGKKPNSFTISVYRSVQTTGKKKGEAGRSALNINGIAVGSGRRLSWPDDYFTLYNEITLQNYNLDNWTRYFLFSDGRSNNFSFKTSLTRSAAGVSPIYPTYGSIFSLSLQVTPPYSIISGKDFSAPNITDREKYKWIEYHKWVFKADWYLRLAGNLVLNTKAAFGYLGHYNDDIGPSPFEGFDLGGDGMTGYSLYGREIIALRGYKNGSLTPTIKDSEGVLKKAGNVYNKLTLELRYPVSLNPQSTIYVLAFLEGGNAWKRFKDFNPFGIRRSAGIGLRAFLPMFGLLGIDWGYGFDEIPGDPDANGGQFHFVIGQQF
jgi:outer membrane protein insertion porin family